MTANNKTQRFKSANLIMEVGSSKACPFSPLACPFSQKDKSFIKKIKNIKLLTYRRNSTHQGSDHPQKENDLGQHFNTSTLQKCEAVPRRAGI